jgi:hypothetical protein
MKIYLLLILYLWPFVMAAKERKLRRIFLNDGEIILLKIKNKN